jgi:hypothetical protein
MGNDLSILYEMENDWKVIKYAHRILNDAEGKRNYDKHLMSLLQNEAPITSTSFPIFPLVQPMSPFVPITDAQRFYSRLPDMSDELEKMIFINNATRGIVIEGSDIDFSRDYYRELGVERGRVRIDTLERTFIYKSKINPTVDEHKLRRHKWRAKGMRLVLKLVKASLRSSVCS